MKAPGLLLLLLMLGISGGPAAAQTNLCVPETPALDADLAIRAVQVERLAEARAVQALAAADQGSCGCVPTRLGESCVSLAGTRSCAARVVERVGEAAVAALRDGAREARLEALRVCLGAARAQLDSGAQPPEDAASPPAVRAEAARVWETRRALGLAISERLVGELEAELSAVSRSELESRVDAWLKKELARRADAFEGLHPRLESGRAECAQPSDLRENWSKMSHPARVNCLIQIIAAGRADSADDLGLAPGSPPAERFAGCLLPNGEADPACCAAADAQRRDEATLGAYDFPRDGRATFRAHMSAFCSAADGAGLLPEARRPRDAALPDLSLPPSEMPTLTPQQIRALVAYLADAESRTPGWREAARKGALSDDQLGAAIDAELRRLVDYLSPYLETPGGERHLRNAGDARDSIDRMIRHYHCFQDTGSACVSERSAP